MRKIFVFLALGGLAVILIVNILQMPKLGDLNNPSYNETSHYYIERAVEDTNAPNVITAIITDYRAFDTLGETTVLFTSIAAVISVMKVGSTSKKEKVGE